MDRPGLLDYAIAPLTWLERTRGRKRLGLVLAYVLIVVVVGLWGYRASSLWRLPDIGEPFDLDVLGSVAVPDSNNAMLLYREAAEKLIKADPMVYKPVAVKAWDGLDWSTADPEVRRWVVDNRPALATWLEGTERPDSLFIQPGRLDIRTPFGPVFAIRDFTRLALLEASRLEAEGELFGAWHYLRASLRSSRHVGRSAGSMQRHLGNQLLEKCRPAIKRWGEEPRLRAEELRRAIADLETCKEMTAPVSEMIRAEYFLGLATFATPEQWGQMRLDGSEGNGEWYNHISMLPTIRRFLHAEPERSLRVHQLITAGRLAQCDRPRQDRPRLVSPKYMIYDVDEKTPRVVASVTPEELVNFADRSVYSALTSDSSFLLARVELEPAVFDGLILEMAERGYQLEHGRPPKTYGELLNTFIKALPTGLEPGDALNPTTSPD